MSADRHGLLEHSREFLDFFWDIAKPHQQTRLEATEKLLAYLRARPEARWWAWDGAPPRSRPRSGGGPRAWDKIALSRLWMPKKARAAPFVTNTAFS